MDRFLVHRDPGSLPGKVIGPAAHEAANKRAPERAALRNMTHAHLGVRAHRGIGRPTAQFLAATTLIEQLLRWPTQRPDSHSKTAPTLTRVITFASHSHYGVHICKLIRAGQKSHSHRSLQLRYTGSLLLRVEEPEPHPRGYEAGVRRLRGRGWGWG